MKPLSINAKKPCKSLIYKAFSRLYAQPQILKPTHRIAFVGFKTDRTTLDDCPHCALFLALLLRKSRAWAWMPCGRFGNRQKRCGALV